MIKPMTCPVCQRAIGPESQHPPGLLPFCSERCRNVDLMRWSDGKYAIVEDIANRQDLLEEFAEEIEQHLIDEEAIDDDAGW